MTPAERAELAFHESGHCVLMVRFGVPFAFACVYDVATNGWGGHVGDSLAPPPALESEPRLQRDYTFAAVLGDPALFMVARLRLVRRAIVDAAGIAAQFHRTRGTSHAHSIASVGDRREFEERNAAWGVRLSWPWFVHQAIEVVDREWGAITGVAAALDARGVLERSQIAEIAAAAPRRWNLDRERPWEEMPLAAID